MVARDVTFVQGRIEIAPGVLETSSIANEAIDRLSIQI